MGEIKKLNGGMNLDDNEYTLPLNDYIDALNITHDAIEGSNDKVVSNIVANRPVYFTYHSGGIPKIIGAKANTLRNTIIEFAWHPTGYHVIIEFDRTLRVRTKIIENLTDTGGVDILGFTQDDKITSINIYNRDEGDLLFFLDSLGRPSGFDITQIKSGIYTPVTRDIIDKAKCPPLSCPTGVYSNDSSILTNNLTNKIFRFKYRYVFDDNEKSTFSPIGELPLPSKILQDTFTSIVTNNNVINLVFPLVGLSANIKAVEIAMSYVNKTNSWSDFELVDTIKKANFGTAASLFYPFYNDSTYPSIDVNESILIADYVPDKANAQEMPNGNILTYAGITDGFDKDLIPNVQNTIVTYLPGGGVVGDLIVTLTVYVPDQQWSIKITGTPVVGAIIVIKAYRKSNGSTDTIAGFTYILGSTNNDAAISIANSINAYGRGLVAAYLSSAIVYIDSNSTHSAMAVYLTIPNSTTLIDSISTWPWSTTRKIGLQYYNKKSKTNGVVYSQKLNFGAYTEDVTTHIPYLLYIHSEIYHQPPAWAWSYQWVVTKEPTYFLFWVTPSVISTDASYLYFDITNISLNATKLPLVATVLSYSFIDGDRMRLIRRPVDNFLFNTDYDAAIQGVVTDPKISGTVVIGVFIKIKKVTPFSAVDYTSTDFGKLVIEIYRPGQQNASGSNETFYEFGQQFFIGNPETDTRYHLGMIQNQNLGTNAPATFNFYKGDSYFRGRTIYLTESALATFYVQDKNFVDFFISAVNSIDGRPTIIDINARKAYYSTMIRHGESYQANTNINGFNRFYPSSFDEYDYSFGDVWRLKVRDRIMRVFQRSKIGAVPLYNQISKNANGTQLLVVTDKLLNPIQYYAGNYGIGTCPESFSSNKFADYGCDNINGVIWRVSNDGIQAISILYKTNSWANDNLPIRKGSKKIYGGFNPRSNDYIIALDGVICVPVSVPSFTLPDANTLVPYNYQVTISGNINFTLANIIKPSWMTISVMDNVITFSGTPTVAGSAIVVSFDVSNDCGLVSVSKIINVVTIACIPVTVVGSPVFPNGTVGVYYTYSFYVAGTAPFALGAVTKPSWAVVSISGDTITISGVPTAVISQTVSIQVTNCSGSSVVVSNNVSITVSSGFGVTLYRSSTLLTFVITDGGTAPYTYNFQCTATGACSSYTIDAPTGTIPGTSANTTYHVVQYAVANYVFFVTVVDNLGATATSNSITYPPCLVPETLITLLDGSKKELGLLKVGENLFGENNKVEGFERRLVDKLYVINDGLLKASEGHIHIISGELVKSLDLVIGDKLMDENDKEVAIDSIIIEFGLFDVINISTTNETYIANGIITHNKIACP